MLRIAFVLAFWRLAGAALLDDVLAAHPDEAGQPFVPLEDEKCAGQQPCFHTTAAERRAAGCGGKLWAGEWDKPGPMGRMAKGAPMNRFHPTAEASCDVSHSFALSSSPWARGPSAEAAEAHALKRLEPLRGKLWFTVGTSIDHRSTMACPTMFGLERKVYAGLGDACHLPLLNATFMYAFIDGLSTREFARSPEGQKAFLAERSQALAKHGWHGRPDMFTLSGTEWDFKHFTEAKRKPDLAGASKAVALWITSMRSQWPRAAAVSFRTTYHADKNYGSKVNYDAYNALIHAAVSDATLPAGQCGQAAVLEMDQLMRNGGSSKTGWTDGLHPAPWVTFAYINLGLNFMADLDFNCAPAATARV
mmetsp:Transcript_16370/g.55261  ORF Transcript_16370/g.55261 Transcript_16370/m.55261 type:complete len:363 (-) Transcript_16370:27-1115(-)